MIDYSKIAAAIAYYQVRGFTYIDVPWTTDEDTMSITVDKSLIVHSDFGCLVGSAEQSFLQMIKDGTLSPGNYVACSPCWRRDQPDELHQAYFMKVELISFGPDAFSVDQMVEAAKSFFEIYLPVSTQRTEIGIDIVDKRFGIELGSYGLRSHPDTGPWVYGTGCAEPRLSKASKIL